MKKIFLHIGLHKTATTSIQLGLYKNSRVLRRMGYLYPDSGMQIWGQHNIPWELKKHYMFDPKKGALDQLINEVNRRKEDKIIISSEAFFLLGSEELAVLCRKLAAFDVKVILYVRNQVDWFQSMWGEISKGRVGVSEVEDIDTWIGKKITPKGKPVDDSPPKHMGNYLHMIDLWESFFGKGNVLVKRFEDEVKGNVFERFLGYVGVDEAQYPLFDQPEKVNESLDVDKLEFIRNMRIAMRKLGCQESAIEDLKWLVLQFDVDKKPVKANKAMYFSKATYHEIIEAFAGVNAEISSRYFDGGDLFGESGVERNFIADSAHNIDPKMFDLFALALNYTALKQGKRERLISPVDKLRFKLNGKNIWSFVRSNRHWVERIFRSFIK